MAQADEGNPSRRRLAAAGWVCAVGAALALGVWSFAQADPGNQYGRPEPLTEAGVQHELDQTKQRARTKDPAPDASPSPSVEHPAERPRTVRFPGGLGTAVAECRTDARTVKLLSWTPAEGYSADDVEPGPALTATVELEPAADDADDRTVQVRCVDGKPRATGDSEADDD
ncbi:hypothetical protein ACQEU8_16970 [Streptomyces sp. CA-250714]|uniref:hypothetical protein n=1 Tax=Streptomyces sp. CA-250714 TaxID=3240060 RepID=UPI003D8E225C